MPKGIEALGAVGSERRKILFGLVQDKGGSGKLLYITELSRGRRSSILVDPADVRDMAELLLKIDKERFVETKGKKEVKKNWCPGCKDPSWRQMYQIENGDVLKNHEAEDDGAGFCEVCGHILGDDDDPDYSDALHS